MMSDHQIALVSAFGQAGAAVIAIPALIALLLQLRAMRQQLDEDRKANRDSAEHQAKYFVVEYLERPENLALRNTRELRVTPWPRWTAELKHQANLLSGMWEVVASLVDAGVVPKDFVKELYGGAICRHWRIVEHQVIEMRADQAEPKQRECFEKLAREFGAGGPLPAT
ncbi:hypothetical protein A5656_19915 [Mycobacterium gordonae]|jgi:hypothetical protein|uniref:DUF4760 domain-containing protein n=1 Tax=Mycobacterium paragordonae TaxID=1389713 RepID=UPI0007F039C4|nr:MULTISPECIES: hypothetical protein [Mycobacterium]OBK56178.1 hypothetical protein A5656_19915 [Mycobacterium gordonae]